MGAVARRRVIAVLAAVTALTASAAFSSASASSASAETITPLTALDGRLIVAHGDDFGGGAMVMQAALQTASGVVRLDVPASEHAQALGLAGQRVHVTGSRLAKSFAAASLTSIGEGSATAHATVTTTPTRTLRIAVVLMRLPGSASEPVSKASAQSSTFGATNSVADWFSQTSGGQVSVTGKVYGYYGGIASCDLAAQLSAGAAAAKNDGYVASDYDSLVVYTPTQACGFSGIAWVEMGGVFMNGTVALGMMAHELGHNLGLLHAGEYACGVAPVAPSCLIDYGDPTDVMGDPGPGRGYNAEHKYQLGWLPEAEVETVATGTQTIALTASENPLVPGSTELIHLRAADGTLYAIDRRASVGYDSGLSGVWIRRVADVNTDDTELVRSTALGAGQTWGDAAHHVTIKTLSDTGPTASVRVCVGPCVTTVGSQSTSPLPAPITARNIVSGSESISGNHGMTLTVPAGQGVVAGHTVVLSVYASNAPGLVSCSDSSGNVYAVNVDSIGKQRLIVCTAYATHALFGGARITVAYPAFTGSSIASANDFTGITASYRVDRKNSGGTNSALVDSGTTATTSQRDELVFGVEIHRGTSSFAAASGFTRVGAYGAFAGSGRMTIVPVFKVVTTIATYELGGELSAGQQWRAAIVTLRKA